MGYCGFGNAHLHTAQKIQIIPQLQYIQDTIEQSVLWVWGVYDCNQRYLCAALQCNVAIFGNPTAAPALVSHPAVGIEYIHYSSHERIPYLVLIVYCWMADVILYNFFSSIQHTTVLYGTCIASFTNVQHGWWEEDWICTFCPYHRHCHFQNPDNDKIRWLFPNWFRTIIENSST